MAVAKRKPTLKVVTQRAAQRAYYGTIPRERVQTYARILLRSIQNNLGGVIFFTREDLLHLSVFQHVSTIYRYTLVCQTVRFLIDTHQVIEKQRTDLCLPDNADKYPEESLSAAYHDTVVRIVNKIGKGNTIGVMDIVQEWRSDPHLTTNNKRVAVRGAMRRMVADGLIEHGDEFEYTIL